MTAPRLATLIQARMGSTRLPGKVMERVADEPVLHWVLHRAAMATHAGELLVVTSELSRDDPVADWCRAGEVACFRGSERDVLDRYYRATCLIEAEIVLRVTADCPLLDPWISDQIVETHLLRSADYVSMEGTPRGIAQETLSRAALEASWLEAGAPGDREHVITYVAERAERFEVILLQAPDEIRRPSWRITLDDSHDLRLLRLLASATAGEVFQMSSAEVIEVIESDPTLLGLASRAPETDPVV